METVVAAAISIEGLTLSLPRPARHGQVLQLSDIVFGDKYVGREVQGFLTSTGRFVTRVEAMNIAFLAKQRFRQKKPCAPPQLYSEDLW